MFGDWLSLRNWIARLDSRRRNWKGQRVAEEIDAWRKLNSDLLEGEAFPEASGSYGLSANNPIPCPDPSAYFACLRAPSGAPVTLLGSRFSVRSSATKKPVDMYPVSFDGEQTAVFVCIYAKRNSTRPPEGFKLL